MILIQVRVNVQHLAVMVLDMLQDCIHITGGTYSVYLLTYPILCHYVTIQPF